MISSSNFVPFRSVPSFRQSSISPNRVTQSHPQTRTQSLFKCFFGVRGDWGLGGGANLIPNLPSPKKTLKSGKALDNINLNQLSHRYVSGVLQND